MKYLILFFLFVISLNSQLYNKEEYNVWKMHKCDTRDLILLKENYDMQFKGNVCDIKEGRWFVEYSNEFFTNSSLIDVDHIIPLRYAHEMGAAKWSKRKKETFANDLENLIISSRKDNRTKKDRGPSEWMPRYNRCAYVVNWQKISTKYQLSLKSSDLTVIENTIKEECQ